MITFAGRKTDKPYTIPVAYFQSDDRFLVFSNQRWWRNLRRGAPVTLLLWGRVVRAFAVPIEEAPVVTREVAHFLARKGLRAASMINIRLAPRADSGMAAIAAATRDHVVIQIHPDTSASERPRGAS